MQTYLTADGLTVGYRKKPVLSNISMKIFLLWGEVYSLTAPPLRITRTPILRKRPLSL